MRDCEVIGMMTMAENERTFWYALYKQTDVQYDDYGNETGDPVIVYEDPVEMSANVSEATGISSTQQFGNYMDYDKVIVTDWMECPIDENTVLYIDTEPDELPDYVVSRVSKSLNSVSIVIRRVVKT